MPQDGNSSATQDNDTHDVEMIDDDISVIIPKTHPPGMINIVYTFLHIIWMAKDVWNKSKQYSVRVSNW